MWLPRVVTVAPASEPVTLAEAKAHCRVDNTASDTLITALILAARQHVEQVTGLAIVAQTVEVRASCWADLAGLPVGPVVSVTSLKYLDSFGVEQTLSSSAYTFIGANTLAPSIECAYSYTWPTVLWQADAIRVVVSAGYSTVPAPLKAAILLLIGQWFERRESTIEGTLAELPHTVRDLLTNYRIYA
jgi:uncharacterized phiE125 gp8 family phage protein